MVLSGQIRVRSCCCCFEGLPFSGKLARLASSAAVALLAAAQAPAAQPSSCPLSWLCQESQGRQAVELSAELLSEAPLLRAVCWQCWQCRPLFAGAALASGWPTALLSSNSGSSAIHVYFIPKLNKWWLSLSTCKNLHLGFEL
jgi:hypothetical protein